MERNKTMKTIILISLILLALTSFGQKNNNYIDYYNLLNEGDHQIYLKNDSLALDYYTKAFEKVNYVHCDYIVNAARIYARINDYEDAYKYSRQAIIQGANIKFRKGKSFKKFRKTPYYKTLKDSTAFFVQTYKNNIDSNYKYLVDSLFYLDQVVIRGAKNYHKRNYKIDKSKLPKDMVVFDSLIFVKFLSLINEYGFPTEDKIGYESFGDVWVIYHHNIRLKKNAKYMSLAQEAVRQGAYLPRDYAWMYDQSTEIKKEEPYFYFGVLFDPADKIKYKDIINKRRKEWGIKPVESSVTKKILQGTRTNQLW